MKGFVVIGLLLVAFLQAEARSIGALQDMPKVLVDTMQQSFSCAMAMGPTKASSIPQIRGIQQLPEDNAALNELWGCIWEKKGIINHNGDLDENNLEGYLDDLVSIFKTPSADELEMAHDMVQQCKNVEADDYGKKAIKIQNCINRYIEVRQ